VAAVVLAGFCLLLMSCQTASSAKIEDAILYYLPQCRHIDSARYSFTSAERQKAIQSMSQAGADTLFELIIDGEGRVKRARLIRTKTLSCYREDMERHAMIMKFTPDHSSEMPYRTFYMPARYRYNSTFEWM